MVCQLIPEGWKSTQNLLSLTTLTSGWVHTLLSTLTVINWSCILITWAAQLPWGGAVIYLNVIHWLAVVMKLSGLVAFCKGCVTWSEKTVFQRTSVSTHAPPSTPAFLLTSPMFSQTFHSTGQPYCTVFPSCNVRCSRHINLTWEAPSESCFWNDHMIWFCSGQIIPPKGRFFPVGQQLSVKNCWNYSTSQQCQWRGRKFAIDFSFLSTNCSFHIKPQAWQQYKENFQICSNVLQQSKLVFRAGNLALLASTSTKNLF